MATFVTEAKGCDKKDYDGERGRSGRTWDEQGWKGRNAMAHGLT